MDDDQRELLDRWWGGLNEKDRDYITEHRDGYLSGEYYLGKVLAAADPPALIVAVTHDLNDNHRFLLPEIIREFVGDEDLA
jgi:hypothetical protein